MANKSQVNCVRVRDAGQARKAQPKPKLKLKLRPNTTEISCKGCTWTREGCGGGVQGKFLIFYDRHWPSDSMRRMTKQPRASERATQKTIEWVIEWGRVLDTRTTPSNAAQWKQLHSGGAKGHGIIVQRQIDVSILIRPLRQRREEAQTIKANA